MARETVPVIVQCDTDTVQAGLAGNDIIPRPAVTVQACYAVPSSSLGEASASNGTANGDEGAGPSHAGWIVGDELDKARSQPEFEAQYQLRWPFRHLKRADDWDGREYVLAHVFSLIGIQIATNTTPLLLLPPSTPAALPLSDQALYTQLAFESLNVPAFSLLPTPLAALFALNTTTGIVLHIGHDTSEITIVTDSVVRWECSTTVQVGLGDCEAHLERLLAADPALETELRAAVGEHDWTDAHKARLVKEVADMVWRECTGEDVEVPAAGGRANPITQAAGEEDEGFDVAKKLLGDTGPAASANTSHKSKKQQQQAQAAASKAAADAAAAEALAAANDVIALTLPSLPGKEIQLGAVRHRLCEPLLLGKERGGDTVWEGIGRAVGNSSLSNGERMDVWEGLGVVGEVARVRSFAPALLTYLAPYLLSSSDLPSDFQPAKARLLSIPDYMTNYKGSTTEVAPFLGGSMAVRTLFSDVTGKHYLSKIDYNTKGPAGIYIVSASDER